MQCTHTLMLQAFVSSFQAPPLCSYRPAHSPLENKHFLQFPRKRDWRDASVCSCWVQAAGKPSLTCSLSSLCLPVPFTHSSFLTLSNDTLFLSRLFFTRYSSTIDSTIALVKHIIDGLRVVIDLQSVTVGGHFVCSLSAMVQLTNRSHSLTCQC